MSITTDGQFIKCDGDGCQNKAAVPVGLRQTLRTGAGSAPAVSGWLYVSRGGVAKHYCASCKSKYLGLLGSWPTGSPLVRTSEIGAANPGSPILGLGAQAAPPVVV